MKQIVGTVTIEDGRPHQYGISETASRYEAVALKGGTYDVFAAEAYGEVRLTARVPAVVTSRYDGAEYFGNPIGNSPQHANHPHVGREVEVSLPVGHGDVEWNADADETVVWVWRSFVQPTSSSGHGLQVHTYRRLTMLATLKLNFGAHRIDGPDLPEFVEDATTLANRVNELQAAGFDPDVWDVSLNADRTPRCDFPFRQHRPYDPAAYREHQSRPYGEKAEVTR